MTDQPKPQDGFKWQGEFFPFTLSVGHPKDIVLTERITRIPIFEYERLAKSGDPALRSGSMLVGLMATSVRAKHPDWDVERIERFVYDLDIENDDFEMIEASQEEEEIPPESAPAAVTKPLTVAGAPSQKPATSSEDATPA
jgi:hypothetical protein